MHGFKTLIVLVKIEISYFQGKMYFSVQLVMATQQLSLAQSLECTFGRSQLNP